MTSSRSTRLVDLGGPQVHVATWGEGPPAIVMLHDGLGSIEQWRGVPELIAYSTGLAVMAYDRPGHGASGPTPTGAWPANWLHREAQTLAALLAACGCDSPHLVGHSDGGSIAAIHATANPVASLTMLAAHSWVESMTSGAIAGMRSQPEPIVRGLARFHRAPEALFAAWSGVWVSEEFGRWDIRPMLHAIEAPTLVVQGEGDEYALASHATATAAAIGDNAVPRLLPDLGHLLHHEDPEQIATLVTDHVVSHHR